MDLLFSFFLFFLVFMDPSNRVDLLCYMAMPRLMKVTLYMWNIQLWDLHSSQLLTAVLN